MIFYIIGFILLFFTLLLIPHDAFLKKRVFVILGVMLYSVVYFFLIHDNAQIASNSGKFYIWDFIIFVVLIYLISLRPFTLLNKKEYYMSFDVLHKSLTLFLLLFINYRGIKLGFDFPFDVKYWVETIILTTLSILISSILAVRINFLEFKRTKIKLQEFFIISIFMFLFVALPEEILFRGVLLNYLNNYIPWVTVSVIISSVIFGVIHLRYGMKMFLLGGLAGLFYSWLYVLTQNLICVAVMHTLVNLFRKYYYITKKQ